MIRIESEASETKNTHAPPGWPLLQKLWDNREKILGAGALVTFICGDALLAASFIGTDFKVVPELFNAGTNLLKVSAGLGLTYLLARSARWAASTYIDTLKDMHGHL